MTTSLSPSNDTASLLASGNLELLVLNGQNIESTGPLLELSNLASHITELDLAQNSLSSWEEVLSTSLPFPPHALLSQVSNIFRVMPNLCHCNLANNPLGKASTPTASAFPALTKMHSLVLNATGTALPSLLPLLSQMPKQVEIEPTKENLPSVLVLRNSISPSTTTLTSATSLVSSSRASTSSISTAAA